MACIQDDCVERQEFLEMLKTLGVLERLQQTRANNIYDDSMYISLLHLSRQSLTSLYSKANTLSNTAGLDWNGFRNAISLVADELQLKSEDIKVRRRQSCLPVECLADVAGARSLSWVASGAVNVDDSLSTRCCRAMNEQDVSCCGLSS
eukprot:747706-Hanusia_phi.AAC.3